MVSHLTLRPRLTSMDSELKIVANITYSIRDNPFAVAERGRSAMVFTLFGSGLETPIRHIKSKPKPREEI